MVKISNNFFGDFNPYKELIHGDWFWPTPKDRKYLRGKQVKGGLDRQDFDAAAKLVEGKDGVYLEINLDKNWLTEQKRNLVTTVTLKPAIIPNLPYENPDGLPLKIDTDYFGNLRNTSNPSPSPFEIKKNGLQKIKLW